MSFRPTIGVVFGTRPEAIKLAPVIHELQRRDSELQPLLISTAQHRQMLDQVLEIFAIRPDVDLNLMTHNQSLAGITSRVLQSMDAVLGDRKIDCLMVQGDTTTAFAAALCAFYHKIPVAHVEAGLRSGDVFNPYPEEVNRHLTAGVTRLHLAPTVIGRDNLLREGIDARDIVVTGNTVVDAAHMLQRNGLADQPLPAGVPDDGSRILLVTSHRRESWGAELENVCEAIIDIIQRFPDVRVVYPVHLNPNVRSTVREQLGRIERVHLTAPLDYLGFLSLLRRSYLVLTDSGGVQEEAPTFGKPVLVLRKVTERPEASMLGLARIVGTSRQRIVREATTLLTDVAAYRSMSERESPYGDGRAAERICLALRRWFDGVQPVLEEAEQFGLQPQADLVAAD